MRHEIDAWPGGTTGPWRPREACDSPRHRGKGPVIATLACLPQSILGCVGGSEMPLDTGVGEKISSGKLCSAKLAENRKWPLWFPGLL